MFMMHRVWSVFRWNRSINRSMNLRIFLTRYVHNDNRWLDPGTGQHSDIQIELTKGLIKPLTKEFILSDNLDSIY